MFLYLNSVLLQEIIPYFYTVNRKKMFKSGDCHDFTGGARVTGYGVSLGHDALKKMRFKMCLAVSVIIVIKQKIFNLANRF